MSFLERVHTGTVDPMDRATKMEVPEHLVTIVPAIQACRDSPIPQSERGEPFAFAVGTARVSRCRRYAS